MHSCTYWYIYRYWGLTYAQTFSILMSLWFLFFILSWVVLWILFLSQVAWRDFLSINSPTKGKEYWAPSFISSRPYCPISSSLWRYNHFVISQVLLLTVVFSISPYVPPILTTLPVSPGHHSNHFVIWIILSYLFK